MNFQTRFKILLIGLVVILAYPSVCAAKDPDHVTILYTSDELGYLTPCG